MISGNGLQFGGCFHEPPYLFPEPSSTEKDEALTYPLQVRPVSVSDILPDSVWIVIDKRGPPGRGKVCNFVLGWEKIEYALREKIVNQSV